MILKLINMDALPPEVLRIICTYLDFQDAANVRFLTPKLASVAAEFLISRVCFHTSIASLKRLEDIANHPIFSRAVKTLVYEAALLANVGCQHEYARHFELDHHGLERPKDPAPICSARERRLHIRNKRKWTQTIQAKYDAYRTLFDAQNSLLDSGTVEQVLSRCIPKFSKLTSMDVDPVRRCTHRLSERFIQEFGSDCASPLSANNTRVNDQCTWMLLPKNHILESLRKLEISSLSPTFFKADRQSALLAVFKSLTDIDIVLTLADEDIEIGENPKASFERHLSTGIFIEILSAATGLEFLAIGVDSTHPVYVDLAALLSNKTWPQMKSLGLSTVSSTQSEFMEMLKRQPKLRSLHVALMELTQGNWPDTLTQMRDQLELDSFSPVGYLEDPNETWPMDLIEVDCYMDSQMEFDLGNAIDDYVTSGNPATGDGLGNFPNPLKDGFEEFEYPDVVREMYEEMIESEEMSLDEDEEMRLTDSEGSWSISELDEDML